MKAIIEVARKGSIFRTAAQQLANRVKAVRQTSG